MNTRNEHGLSIGNLTMRLVYGRNIKLLVFRNDNKDLPHLTISWQNASNEIDIHLKRRTSGGNENHQSIAKIHESVLKQACESLGAKVFKVITANVDKVRKVRPGWLARNGYIVLYLPNDVQERLIQKLTSKQKRHGKWTHIVDKYIITGMNQPQEIIDGLHHPAMLHYLAELDYREPILAASGRKKCKHRLISLMLVTNPNGSRSWVRIDNLAKEMMKNLEKLMLSSLKELLPNNAWTTIHNELQLDGIGFES